MPTSILGMRRIGRGGKKRMGRRRREDGKGGRNRRIDERKRGEEDGGMRRGKEDENIDQMGMRRIGR